MALSVSGLPNVAKEGTVYVLTITGGPPNGTATIINSATGGSNTYTFDKAGNVEPRPRVSFGPPLGEQTVTTTSSDGQTTSKNVLVNTTGLAPETTNVNAISSAVPKSGSGGNGVRNFLNDVAGGFFGNDYLRDFQHAAKTFRSANYQNAPKFKFLFHVYFDLNAPGPKDANGSTAKNFGLLVKNVKLPNFTFQTTELNQYNRKRIVQTKIKYDPIDISFHDDNRNLITSLWYDYYTYYYNDASLVKDKVYFTGNRGGQPAPTLLGGGVTAGATAASYNTRTQYAKSITGDDTWGYIGEPTLNNIQPTSTSVKIPFFNKITIFGLTQHNFIAYTLVNPIITRFGHDTYDYEQSNGIMQNTMTVDYETVVYNQGAIDGNLPDNIMFGFGDKATYDRILSPISTPGSNSNILGKGGIIDSAGGAIEQLVTPGGNILGAIKTAGAIVNSVKNINLKTQISAEITQGLQNALQGSQNPTRQKLVDIPGTNQTPSSVGTAGAATVAQAYPQNIGSIAGVVNNVVTAGVTAVTGFTNTIAGTVNTVAKYAGTQNNVNGKPAPSAPPNSEDYGQYL